MIYAICMAIIVYSSFFMIEGVKDGGDYVKIWSLNLVATLGLLGFRKLMGLP